MLSSIYLFLHAHHKFLLFRIFLPFFCGILNRFWIWQFSKIFSSRFANCEQQKEFFLIVKVFADKKKIKIEIEMEIGNKNDRSMLAKFSLSSWVKFNRFILKFSINLFNILAKIVNDDADFGLKFWILIKKFKVHS